MVDSILNKSCANLAKIDRHFHFSTKESGYIKDLLKMAKSSFRGISFLFFFFFFVNFKMNLI